MLRATRAGRTALTQPFSSASLAGGQAGVSSVGASGQSRQPQPPLLPRLRRAGLLTATPRHAAAASGVCKLPALPAAASSTSSPRGRARAMGIRGSRLPVLAPRPPGTLHVQDGTARPESQGPALEVSAVLRPRHARSRQNCVVSLSCAAAASSSVEVQLAVPGCMAP